MAEYFIKCPKCKYPILRSDFKILLLDNVITISCQCINCNEKMSCEISPEALFGYESNR